MAFARLHNVDLVTKSDVLKYSDVVSLHVPLNNSTKNFIVKSDIELMQSNAVLINTARGGIVSEADLYECLSNDVISGAAVDVFEGEPYSGSLKLLENCLLTCHMGASTIDSRSAMELEAVEEVIRFNQGEGLKNEVFEKS